MDNKKWNRRLMNLYWICNIVIVIVELAISIAYFNNKMTIFPNPEDLLVSEYFFSYILIPSGLTFLTTAACEIIVKIFEKKQINLCAYVITFTCVIFCMILILVHYSVNVIYVTSIIPMLFSLIYNDKRVLWYTFLFSLFCFIGVFSYMSTNEFMYLRFDFAEVITSLAIILISYLICKVILSRFSEIVDVLVETERSMYESKMAKENAEALAETRARFLANMSHEIRTPMNGIIGLAELALNPKNDFKSSEKKEDYLFKIKNSAIGLLDIVNDILDISQIDAGEIKIENKAFDLNETLKECETLIIPVASQKGLRLYVYNETNINQNIMGDPTRLRQALLNLLSNAVKFTGKGSVTLLAKTDKHLTDSNKTVVYFEVRDTGMGILKEQKEEIFEPFKQGDDSNTRSFGGTGLGLTITKKIIKTMGGEIEVDSIPNVGSKFYFYLEFNLSDKECEDKNVININEMKQPIFKGEVLVCEDNEIGRQIAKENFIKVGLKVVLAENGKIGVDIANKREKENNPFDIIFMDIHMPVMDGLEATKLLIDANIKTPIIAMTANVMPHDRETYLNSGMTACLYKPFRSHELWSCLMRFLTPVEMVDNTSYKTETDKNTNEPVDKVIGLENNIGNKELYNKSIRVFIEEQPKILVNLEDAILNKDFVLAKNIAHTAKNNAKLIGATKLDEILTILEEALRYDSSYFKKDMMDAYKEELSITLNYLSNN